MLEVKTSRRASFTTLNLLDRKTNFDGLTLSQLLAREGAVIAVPSKLFADYECSSFYNFRQSVRKAFKFDSQIVESVKAGSLASLKASDMLKLSESILVAYSKELGYMFIDLNYFKVVEPIANKSKK